jgi:hypothetical protein
LAPPELRRPLTSRERTRTQNKLVSRARLAMRTATRTRTMTKTKRRKRRGMTGYKRKKIWKKFQRKVAAAIGERQMITSYSTIGTVPDFNVATTNTPINILDQLTWPAQDLTTIGRKGDFIHLRHLTVKFNLSNTGDNWSQNALRIIIFKSKHKSSELNMASTFDITGLPTATAYLLAPFKPGMGKVLLDTKVYVPPTVANQNGETMNIQKTFLWKHPIMRDCKKTGTSDYSISNRLLYVFGPSAAFRSGTGNTVGFSVRLTYSDS